LTIVVGVQWNKDKTGYEPAFKNAKFWTMKVTEWATKPNRERRLLLSENILPMQESGQQFYQRPR
jgi:hypothetical protein